ncbi:hypothetical protein [Bradyrhizobium sp. WSM1253]|uniref:hypothetical protein n=1 Tax=Bradyrhizobium sp. WSM1253 TaxID=319003 RepID=UPI00025D2957|nr:hypothetical protein [Bradyrhizobium sp. WSM1253]EIG61331.1 hypothetical protein Bra1253DRAFT_06166 [Bradyrhizobium sp. WSM1253]
MIDPAQTKASLKPKPQFYGAPVGILMFERPRDPFDRPFIPGSVGNASSWSVPVRYKTMPGLSFDRILGPNAGDVAQIVAHAAAELVDEGAQLITSNCGFMIRYQEPVRAAVDVPVLLSSLLLGPFLERALPQGKALGIITANASSLSPDLLAAAGLRAERVVISGLEGAPAFSAAFLSCNADLDIAAVESETVDAAVALLETRPDIGMLLLECSELPPFAAAVQRATGIPVFDFTSMVEFFVRGLIRRPFTGVG